MLLEIPYASMPRNMIDMGTLDLDGVRTESVITVRDIPALMSDKIEQKVDPDSIVLRISESRRSTAHAETEVEQSE